MVFICTQLINSRQEEALWGGWFQQRWCGECRIINRVFTHYVFACTGIRQFIFSTLRCFHKVTWALCYIILVHLVHTFLCTLHGLVMSFAFIWHWKKRKAITLADIHANLNTLGKPYILAMNNVYAISWHTRAERTFHRLKESRLNENITQLRDPLKKKLINQAIFVPKYVQKMLLILINIKRWNRLKM